MSFQKTAFCFGAFILAFTSYSLDLVRDGLPQAEIIVSENAPQGVKLAARDLQNFTLRISGAKLEIVNRPTGKFRNRLFVGENRFTEKLGYRLPEFRNSGFDLLVKEDYAVFAGPNTIFPRAKYTRENRESFWKYMGNKISLEFFNPGSGVYNQILKMDVCDDIGAWYAVVEVLERFGVRFYAPYENGTIIPCRKNLSLESGRTTREAAYGIRQYTYYRGMREDAEGVLWLKRTGCGVRSGFIMSHTTRALLAYQENRKGHPSWYAEESPGKIYTGSMGQGGVPRYTDPDFQKVCIDWANKLLDTYPMLSAVTLGSPDGGNLWDWRDQQKYCKPGMTLQQAYADMMWDFHRAVAKGIREKHPDKNLIWWCQYNDSVPTNIKPEKLNIVFPGSIVSPYLLALKSFFSNALLFQKNMREQTHSSGKAPNWEWWLPFSRPNPRYPIFFTRILQAWRQAQLPYSDGVFIELSPERQCSGVQGEAGQRIGAVPLVHLMVYLNNKLLWNPNLNLHELLDEYYRLWFGPAAGEMKRFHEFAEMVWSRDESRSVTENSGFLKEQDVPKYFELLAEAKAKTEAGTIYYQRIEAMEKGYASLKKLFPSLKRTGPLVRVYSVPNDTKLDGVLGKYKYGWMNMVESRTGEEQKRNATQAVIAMSQDRSKLFIGVRCYEVSMDKIARKCKARDDRSIFEDDLVEVYLDTPERNYFKIAVNPNGAIWDETTDVSIINRDSMGILWNPGTRAIVKSYPDRWEVEIMIPTGDFGKLGPTMQYPWGLNICRTRISSLGFSRQKGYCITPMGNNPFKTQKHWARMWMR